MSNGWIKLHRSLKDKAFYCKDSEKVHLWVHLLMCANHEDREEHLGGKPIICKSGQFTTGRKQLSQQTGINESKVERILEYFEKKEGQIEQQKTNTNRLISIHNWNEYQKSEQQVNNDRTTSEQQVNNDRTTSEHTTRTKELNNLKNKENKNTLDFSIFEENQIQTVKKWIDQLFQKGKNPQRAQLEMLWRKINEIGFERFEKSVYYSIMQDWGTLVEPEEKNHPEESKFVDMYSLPYIKP